MLEVRDNVALTLQKALESVDSLLEGLPESEIAAFASSEYFPVYSRTVQRWEASGDHRSRRWPGSVENRHLTPAELRAHIQLLVYLRELIHRLPSSVAQHLVQQGLERLATAISELELIGIAAGMSIDVTQTLDEG